jgi:hypothetical protein
MLQLRPNYECCGKDLPPGGGRCPNCGGELVRRPIRPADKLAKYPASTERVFHPERCQEAAAGTRRG